MDKFCEFCKSLISTVYCESDSAYLCLPCDLRVHSANALSYRHSRAPVCDSCKYRPSYVRCSNHDMFMCKKCDKSHHATCQHRRRTISNYVGCPSGKDLAELWGFDLSQQGNKCIAFTETEEGCRSRGKEVVKDDSSRSILQQIQALENHHLSEGIDSSCLIHVKEKTSELPYEPMRKVQKYMDNHMEDFYGNLDFQSTGNSHDETVDETFTSQFSEMNDLTSRGNASHGDSFWQYKSLDNEIWLQNMQDLGVCDEAKCFDNINTPDVDLTFRNFEELFGTEQDLTRESVTTFSFSNKDSSSDKVARDFASTFENISRASPKRFKQRSDDVGEEIDCFEQVYQFKTSCYDSKSMRSDGNENVIMRHKEKKYIRHEKQAQYGSLKSKSDGKKRGKVPILKVEALRQT